MSLSRCPVCRARLREEPICPRCGADLRLALQTASRAQWLEQSAIRQLAADEPEAAMTALLEARQLHRTPWSSAMLQFLEHHRSGLDSSPDVDQTDRPTLDMTMIDIYG